MISSPTVLAYSRAERAVIVAGFPLAGLLVGALLPPLARWMLSWHVALPMRFLVRAVGSVDRPWEVAVQLVVWGAVGAGVALAALREGAVVEVTDGELRVRGDGGDRVVARADAVHVFADGPALVVLDGAGRQLVRERLQVTGRPVARAFSAHGFPWRSGDPLADRFRPWTPGEGQLTPAGEELLAARAAVLGKDARRADALRMALEELGIVVREERTTQFWRRLDA